MVAYTKVINGISRFWDEEIVNKLTGLSKLALGVGGGILMTNATNTFNAIKTIPIVKTMGLINEKDEIDIELIYKELKKQLQKGAVTIDIPIIGALTLTDQDADKLYSMIMGG